MAYPHVLSGAVPAVPSLENARQDAAVPSLDNARQDALVPSLGNARQDAALNCTVTQCASLGMRCIATHSEKGGAGQQDDAAVRATVARQGCHDVLAICAALWACRRNKLWARGMERGKPGDMVCSDGGAG